MRVSRAIVIVVVCSLLCLCERQTKIVLSDELIKLYPSDPVQFQQKYGGHLKYYVANNEIKEKMANIDMAVVEGDGFEVTFWMKKQFYLHDIRLKKNSLRVGTAKVIGKRVAEIIAIFGTPTAINELGTLIYKGKETYLGLGVENGVTTDCYWGFEL